MTMVKRLEDLRPQFRPSLDHYIGRRVLGTKKKDDLWEISLDGGVTIRNLDPTKSEEPEIDGLVFAMVMMGELDTRMVFGNPGEYELGNQVEVELNPTKYSISDPRYGEEIIPQMLDKEEQLMIESLIPKDPSAERV